MKKLTASGTDWRDGRTLAGVTRAFVWRERTPGGYGNWGDARQRVDGAQVDERLTEGRIDR
jgi:hypothetical protein